MFGHGGGQLAGQLSMAPELQLQLEPLLQRGHPLLVEPVRVPEQHLALDALQRGAAPQAQCLAQPVHRTVGVRLPGQPVRPLDLADELLCVHARRSGAQHEAAVPADDLHPLRRGGAEGPAQRRDTVVDLGPPRRRRPGVPDGLDQELGTHRTPGPEHQRGQDLALAGAADPHRLSVDDHAHRPEHAELHRSLLMGRARGPLSRAGRRAVDITRRDFR